jgi:hypothetical protein
MSRVTFMDPQTVDGTSGGVIAVDYKLPNFQISVSGRATGTLTFTGRSRGSDVYEAFQPALTLDLSTERTASIKGYFLDSITVAVSIGGADCEVTIIQWDD